MRALLAMEGDMASAEVSELYWSRLPLDSKAPLGPGSGIVGGRDEEDMWW